PAVWADAGPRRFHGLLGRRPFCGLEKAPPVGGGAPALSEALRHRLARGLAAPAEHVEQALELWASEHNLERRVLPGRVDPVVLEVVERSEGAVLAEAAAETPQTGWPR